MTDPKNKSSSDSGGRTLSNRILSWFRSSSFKCVLMDITVSFLILVIFGTPVAVASYPMAVNMGGDGELAGQLVVVSTLLSLATIFLFIFCMAQLGLLI